MGFRHQEREKVSSRVESFCKMEGVERITKEEAEARGLEPSKAYLATAEDAAEEGASKAK